MAATLTAALSRQGNPADDRQLRPALTCDCGLSLEIASLPERGEIVFHCQECATRYVVDQMGAGEELQCRCGTELIVPSVNLQVAEVRAPQESTPREIPSQQFIQEYDQEHQRVVPDQEHSDQEHSDQEHSDQEHCDQEHSDQEHSEELERALPCDQRSSDHIADKSPPVFEETVCEEPANEEIAHEPAYNFYPSGISQNINPHAKRKILVSGNTNDETHEVNSPVEPSYAEEAPANNLPATSLPANSLPEDSLPEDSLPEDSTPEDSAPQSSVVSSGVTASSACSGNDQPPLEDVSTIDPPPVIDLEQDHSSPNQSPHSTDSIPESSETPSPDSNSAPADPTPTETSPKDSQPAEFLPVDSTSSEVQVHCPGCRRPFAIATSELGQTAECECGFVFLLTIDTAEKDLLFQSDLVADLPVAVDRTASLSERERETYTRVDPPASVTSPRSRPRAIDKSASGDTTTREGLIFRAVFALAAILVVATSSHWIPMTRSPVKSSAVTLMSSQRSIRPPTAIHANPAQALPKPTPLAEVTEQPAGSSQPTDLSELDQLKSLAAELMQQETLPREVLYRFADLVQRFGSDESRFTVPALFWIGETWEQLGERAASPHLAYKCYWQSAAAYAMAKTVDGIDASELAVATQRQTDLSKRLRQASRLALKSAESSRE